MSRRLMEPGSKRAFYLGRYNCIERLGEGPLGETWRAKVYGVAGFEKQFAVKRLRAELCQDEAFVSRFVDAATAYASLDHERIARVHEVNVQGAQYYVASDLIRGIDLGKLGEALGQRGEAMSPDAAMLIALDIADALGHAHARNDLLQSGVLHLGLSPRSIMITHEGEVRVLDVGLCAPLVRPGWADAAHVAQNAPYFAPEVLRGSGFDARADVFSLGVLLYELVSGRPPFSGTDTTALLQQMSTVPAMPPCDPRLQSLLARALEANPANRLASMAGWREQLVPILASRANRARSDLASVIRRVARPERKTGAFPVVAMPAMPPPPPPTPPAQKSWSPPVDATVRKVPPPPIGGQLSPVPLTNTLAGVGPDDAAVLPLELVELPGTPTVPSMGAVSTADVDRGWSGEAGSEGAGGEDAPTKPVERVDLEAPTSKVEKAQVEADVETSKFDKGSANGVGGLYSDSGDTATTENPFARTMPGTPIPADPKRFPSLAAEDARDSTQTDSQAGTLPSMPALPMIAAPAEAPRAPDPASLLTRPSGGMAAVAGPAAGAPTLERVDAQARVVPPAIPLTTSPPATPMQPVTPPPPATPMQPVTATPPATPMQPVTPPPPATPMPPATATRPATPMPPATPGREVGSGAFVPPPLGLPPVPESRPWLFLVLVAVLVAGAVAGVLYFVYWKEGAPAGSEVASVPVRPGELPPATAGAGGPPGATAGETAAPGTQTAPAGGAAPGTEKAATAGNAATGTGAAPSGGAATGGATTGSATTGGATPGSAATGGATTGTAAGGTNGGSAGNVDIVTTPEGAAVYIDGEERGKSPLKLQLTPGSHRVVALLDGGRMRRESVKVGQGLTQVNLSLDPVKLPEGVAGPAGLKVRCAKTQGELRILVDGEDTGRQCPNEERISVKGGTHRIGLYSPRTDQTVEVEKEIADDGAHSTRIYLKY
jgi:serine/threonine protein kinase